MLPGDKGSVLSRLCVCYIKKISLANTFTPGDLTISFDENIRSYRYDMFDGVNYKINIGKAPGNRIEDLA